MPFQLSSVQQQFVDQVLMMWENESNKITTYSCDFERWEYDPVFGPGVDIPLIKSQGQLTYAKPDKGSFKINTIHRWVRKDTQQTGQHVLQKNEVGEHWVCDGKAIYEYKHNNNNWSYNLCHWSCAGNRSSMARYHFYSERKRKK